MARPSAAFASRAKAREKSRSPAPTARGRPEAGGHGRPAAAQLGRVEDVVVDQGRHVDELDRGGGADGGGLPVHPGAEQDQQRSQALAAGRQRRAGVSGEDLAVALGLFAEQVLDLAQASRQPGTRGVEHRRDRGRDGRWSGHPAMPVWMVTIPPARIV